MKIHHAKKLLFVVVITLMGQLSSANSLKQLLGSVGCNLNQDSQLKNSSEKIEKFVIEKDYLKAWREFNVSFRQSESDKAMSCYYNLKKDELRKLAIEDLRELQKSLKEYEIQRDIGKYELFLEGFKVIFGQFWFYTSPGGPMKEPLTGKFYEKHLAIANKLKATLSKEEDERNAAAEEARKEEEEQRQLAEEMKIRVQERLAKEVRKKELIAMQKKDAEKRIAIERSVIAKPASSTSMKNSSEQRPLSAEELKAYFIQKVGGVSVEGYCKVVALRSDIHGASGINKESYFECLRTMTNLPLNIYREYVEENIAQHVASWATSPDIIDRGIQGWYVEGRKPISGQALLTGVTNDLELTFKFSPQSFLKEIQSKVSGLPNMMASSNFMGTIIDDLSVGANVIKTEDNLLKGADCFVQVFSKPDMQPDDVLINLKSREKCTRLFVAVMEVLFKKSDVKWETEYNRIWNEDFSKASPENINMLNGPLSKVRHTMFLKHEESGGFTYGIFISRKKKK